MRVRFVNRVFPPGSGATGLYLAEMADALAALGWSVEVVTGPAPGAPRRETRASGVEVRRLGGDIASARSLAKRALGYAALWPRLVREAAHGPKPDVLVLKTDPPLLLLAGPFLRRRTGARIIHWAQDVYPDVAEALGVLSKGSAPARVLRQLTHRALRRYDAVVAIGRCMADRITSTGVSQDRVRVIPNWAPAGVGPIDRDVNPFLREHGLSDAFVVMYSGNLGLAHPIGALLDAAERLECSVPQARVVFVGGGPRRAWAEAEVERRRLSTVQFLPFQPASQLSESLGAADVHFVAMEEALSGLVVPSKLYGALAVGRPVVFVGPEDSEAARLLSEYDCGSVVSVTGLGMLGDRVAEAVEQWASDAEAAHAAGDRAMVASRGLEDASQSFDRLLRDVTGSRAHLTVLPTRGTVSR